MTAVDTTPRYWWHTRIARELAVSRDEYHSPVMSVGDVALICGFLAADTNRYVDELIAWGDVVEVDGPAGLPGRWVALAGEGS